MDIGAARQKRSSRAGFLRLKIPNPTSLLNGLPGAYSGRRKFSLVELALRWDRMLTAAPPGAGQTAG